LLLLRGETLLGGGCGEGCEKGASGCAIGCMRSAIEVVGVAGQWGADTRPESLLPSQPLRGVVPFASTITSRLCAGIIIVLLGIVLRCLSYLFISCKPPSQTSTRATLHALHIRIHGHSRSATVALASSNFGHSVTAQGLSSRPSAGSLRLLPGCSIPFFLSLRDLSSSSGAFASLAQDDHSGRRSARADIRILLRPIQSSWQQ